LDLISNVSIHSDPVKIATQRMSAPNVDVPETPASTFSILSPAPSIQYVGTLNHNNRQRDVVPHGNAMDRGGEAHHHRAGDDRRYQHRSTKPEPFDDLDDLDLPEPFPTPTPTKVSSEV
jgi:hypothetical protein